MLRGNHIPRRAFSLVEVLVAVAIIAVLAGLLIAVTTRARAAARTVQCASNLHQISLAFDSLKASGSANLPDSTAWTSTVIQAANSDKILYCPEIATAKGTVMPFTVPTFDYKPRTNRGHPANWTNPDPNTYNAQILYQKNKPEQALVTFTRIIANSWLATVIRIDPAQPYGGPPIDMLLADGTRHDNLQVGQKYVLTLGDAGSNYGFNIEASNTAPTAPKILVMDYNKILIDFDGLNNDDDDPAVTIAARHSGKVHVLFSDASVQLLSPKDLFPSTGLYKITP